MSDDLIKIFEEKGLNGLTEAVHEIFPAIPFNTLREELRKAVDANEESLDQLMDRLSHSLLLRSSSSVAQLSASTSSFTHRNEGEQDADEKEENFFEESSSEETSEGSSDDESEADRSSSSSSSSSSSVAASSSSTAGSSSTSAAAGCSSTSAAASSESIDQIFRWIETEVPLSQYLPKLCSIGLSEKNSEGRTILHVWGTQGDIHALRWIFSNHRRVARQLLSNMDKWGWTALHCAASGGHLDACLLLLKHSSEFTVRVDRVQATRFCTSSARGGFFRKRKRALCGS